MNVLVPLAHGFEEIEAVTIIDVLRRAGIDVVSAYLESNPVTGSHGISLLADSGLDALAADDFSCIALPGGMPGSENLRNDARVLSFISRIHENDGIAAAVCAAPIVLARAGILSGKKATCFPGFENQLNSANPVTETVIRDGNIITGRGPGCAIPFALELIAAIKGKETAEQIKQAMQVYWM